MHAVEAAAAVGEHAKAVHQLSGGLAPALLALCHLESRLGVVRKAGGGKLIGQACDALHQLHGGGVLGVESHEEGGQLAHLIDDANVLLHQPHGTAEVVEARGLNRAKAAVHGGLGVHRREKVHIKVGGNAAGQILHYAQDIEPVDVVLLQLPLAGEDRIEEPALQGQIVCEGSQEGHGRVGVGVLKAGHKQLARGVNLAVESRSLGRSLHWAHVGDHTAIHMELALYNLKFFILIQDQNPGVVKSCLHEILITKAAKNERQILVPMLTLRKHLLHVLNHPAHQSRKLLGHLLAGLDDLLLAEGVR